MKFKLVSGLSNSDIKEDALGLEVTTLEEIVKAVEVKESAKAANRTLGKRNVKVNEVTRGTACMECGDTTHGHTKEDRLRRCPYRDKRCPRCTFRGHKESLCYGKVPQKPKKPQAGRVKEVKEEFSPQEETLWARHQGVGGAQRLPSHRQ